MILNRLTYILAIIATQVDRVTLKITSWLMRGSKWVPLKD